MNELDPKHIEDNIMLHNRLYNYLHAVDPEPTLTLKLHESQRDRILAACRYFVTLFGNDCDVPVDHIAALGCLVDDLQKLKPEGN